MKYKLQTLIIPLIASGTASITAANHTKPNVIVILVDDMGYSDIGCYGGEIPTPNIDKLAENGLRFKQFYNTSRSCPTRASLLTGLYQHQTGVGLMSSEAGTNFDFGVDGYRGYLNNNCVTIAEVLQQNGYHTYMTGKWHLGSDSLYKRPLQRGFDNFYGCYAGAISYFDPQGLRCLIDGNDTVRAPKDFYSTDAFTQKAIEFIDTKKDKTPFFLYLAYNAPHWPLHAKKEDIQKFVGKYMDGWDKLRQDRFERQLKMGLFDTETELSPRDNLVRAWDFVSEQQKKNSDYRMAVYAAQIYSIDYNVGRLVNYLKKTNQLENTLIMFMSDNGACPEPYKEFGGGEESDVNDPNKAGAVSYGIGWANLSNTPFRKFKINAEEGGINTPFIAHWPAQLKSQKGKFTNTIGHVLNIMPTVLEVTNANYPNTYRGNEIQHLEGMSLLPTFLTGKQEVPEYQFFEHSNNCAATKGDWKAVSRFGSALWELYNLKTDKTELNNVADQYPDILLDLINHWHEWSLRCKVIPKGQRTKNSFD